MLRVFGRALGLGLVSAVVFAPLIVFAQKADSLSAEVPVVRGLPFSATGTVTTRMVLLDGTRIEQHTPAKYFRDSMGRVRREQNIVGLTSLNPAGDSQYLVTILDPVAGYVYTIVGNKKEVQRTPLFEVKPEKFTKTFQKPPDLPVVPVDLGTKEEELGKKEIEGLMAAGRRTTTIIPKGFLGNDRAIEVTDERWESLELKVLVLSRHYDPRSGEVEYRLAGIKRAEPPKELFFIPTSYKVIDLTGRVPDQR
jgi:hypothetical protein